MYTMIEFIMNDILSFHDELESTFSLTTGIRQIDLLESAVYAPFQTFYGQDLYESVYDKAAQLCFGICKNHPFVDGNKRTAVHSMLVFLDVNDIELVCSDDALEDIIIAIASSQMCAEELSAWLEENSLIIT